MTGRGGGGPQQLAKACLAGADHSGDSGRLRHRRDQVPGRDLRTMRVALARAVPARGGCRPVALHDALTQSAAPAGDAGNRVLELTLGSRRVRRRASWRRSVASRCFGAAHLGGAQSAAALGATVQAVGGPGLLPPNCGTWSALSRPPAHSLVLSVDKSRMCG